MKGRTRWLTVAGSVGAAVLVVSQLAFGAGASGFQVIARGLNNPRGVAVGPDGSVFVANAGAAGSHCQGKGEEQMCLGFTGSIDRIVNGKQERYAAGFGSGGSRDGSFSVGVDGITVDPSGKVYGIETTHGPNPEKDGPEFAAQAGHVLRVDHGTKTAIGDSVGAYEFKHNPANDNLDSDPYGLAWSPLGFAVADAAANSLVLVGPSGRVTTLATFKAQVFPGRLAAQSVPTSVVWHDGAFYVGELGGGRSRTAMPACGRSSPARDSPCTRPASRRSVGSHSGPDGACTCPSSPRQALPPPSPVGSSRGP